MSKSSINRIPPRSEVSESDAKDDVFIPWRDALNVHIFCALFPPMSQAELQVLADDIRLHGLKERVKLVEIPDKRPESLVNTQYLVVDGRNRLDALELLGKQPWAEIADGCTADEEYFEVVPLADDSDAAEYVMRQNLCRRNLTGDQHSEIARQLLAAQPTDDDRAMAADLKVGAKLVAAVRRRLLAESDGGVAGVEDQPEKPKSKQKSKKVALADVVGAADGVSAAQEGMFG